MIVMRLIKSLALMFFLALVTFAETPKAGDRAPDFSLPSHTGKQVALRDYAGKSNLVLVFYRGYW
jgi:peroxiredoxin